MSKSKPLPPRRADLSVPQIAAILDAKGNRIAAESAAGLALPHSHTLAHRYESHAVHCPANEDRFKQLASEMTSGSWELIAVVPHQRFVTLNGNSGMSNGWMTFWKRIAQQKPEENTVNESA